MGLCSRPLSILLVPPSWSCSCLSAFSLYLWAHTWVWTSWGLRTHTGIIVSLDLLVQVSLLWAFLAASCLSGALGWNWTDNKLVNKKIRHWALLLISLGSDLIVLRSQAVPWLSSGDHSWSSFGRTGWFRWTTRLPICVSSLLLFLALKIHWTFYLSFIWRDSTIWNFLLFQWRVSALVTSITA